MGKRHRNILGLHTKGEQEEALRLATQVYQDAKKRILERDDQDAFMFAVGYLSAVRDLLAAEDLQDRAAEVGLMRDDLERFYYEIPRG